MIPEELFDRHRVVLDRFLARARAVDEAGWTVPRSEGKWSPAEVCEHVALAYEAFLREASRGEPMKIRLAWWQRFYLRLSVLPSILGKGRIPEGAIAPRETRPARTPPRDEVLGRIVSAWSGLEQLLRNDGAVRLTHPYFGKLSGRDGLRFAVVHTAHHEKQLPCVLTS